MHNDFENEIKKGKEVKETTVPQDYEDEDQAMENSMENSCMEEESLEEHYMPPVAVSNKSCHLDSETESECKSSKVKGSCKGSKTNVAREKWLTVTGRKPRNIPTIRRYLYENKERPKIVFFGDRRPAEVEKLRQEKWMKMIADEAYKKSTFNNGIVIREIRLPDNTEAVTSVRYHPDAEYVTTGFRNGGVQVLI